MWGFFCLGGGFAFEGWRVCFRDWGFSCGVGNFPQGLRICLQSWKFPSGFEDLLAEDGDFWMAIILSGMSDLDFIEWRLFMVIIFFQVGIILRALAIIRERQILEIFELQLISGICNYPSEIYDFLTLENLIFLEFQLSSWIL